MIVQDVGYSCFPVVRRHHRLRKGISYQDMIFQCYQVAPAHVHGVREAPDLYRRWEISY